MIWWCSCRNWCELRWTVHTSREEYLSSEGWTKNYSDLMIIFLVEVMMVNPIVRICIGMSFVLKLKAFLFFSSDEDIFFKGSALYFCFLLLKFSIFFWATSQYVNNIVSWTILLCNCKRSFVCTHGHGSMLHMHMLCMVTVCFCSFIAHLYITNINKLWKQCKCFYTFNL